MILRESAARARGAICRTVKCVQMIQSGRVSAEMCYSIFFMNGGENLRLLVLSLNSQRLCCNYITGCSLTRYMSAVTVLFLVSIHC